MARIRYLKPDFFKDEDIKELPYEARLFYQGLWVQADREGRGEDRPERLKIEIMPYDEVDAEEIMRLLSQHKKNGKRPFIVRYEIDGEKYYQIINWQKHQKPHKTERDSDIPPPPKELLTVKQPLTNGYATNISVGNRNGDGDGKHISAWVKNDHLGFEIMYNYQGVVRKYWPDFIIKLTNGKQLILETKGKDDDRNKIKRDFLDEWVQAINTHGGFGKWAWAVSRHPSDLEGVLNSSASKDNYRNQD